jgi:hypothetical protein
MKLSHRPDAPIGRGAPIIFVVVEPCPMHKHEGDCTCHHSKSPHGILSVRSALILALAVLTALIGAGIMKLGNCPDVLILLGTPSTFAAATVFYGRVIDRG